MNPNSGYAVQPCIPVQNTEYVAASGPFESGLKGIHLVGPIIVLIDGWMDKSRSTDGWMIDG